MSYSTQSQITQRVATLAEQIIDEQLTHAAAGGADTLARDNVTSLSYINDTQGAGPDDPDYAATTDYLLTGDTVDWSPAGSEPNVAANYYVSYLYQPLTAAEIAVNIAAADSIIDGFAAGAGYDLPFAATPALCQTLSIDLAAFYCARDIHGRTGKAIPELVQADYDRALALLKLIAAGDVLLTDAAGAVETSDDQVKSNTSGYTRTAMLDDPENWSIDPDRLDDIADERD